MCKGQNQTWEGVQGSENEVLRCKKERCVCMGGGGGLCMLVFSCQGPRHYPLRNHTKMSQGNKHPAEQHPPGGWCVPTVSPALTSHFCRDPNLLNEEWWCDSGAVREKAGLSDLPSPHSSSSSAPTKGKSKVPLQVPLPPSCADTLKAAVPQIP